MYKRMSLSLSVYLTVTVLTFFAHGAHAQGLCEKALTDKVEISLLLEVQQNSKTVALESILKRVKHYEIRLSDGTDQFIQDPVDPRTVKAYEEMPFAAQVEVASVLQYMNPVELTLIANNREEARKLVIEMRTYNGPLSSHLSFIPLKSGGPELGDYLQWGAKLLLLRIEFPHLATTRTTQTLQALKKQAEIVGLRFVQIPQAFRYDSRSPKQIIEAKGFFSNPGSEVGTLLEHSVPNTSGSGFISTTTRSGNTTLATAHFIVRSGEYLNPQLSKPDIIELARKALGNNFDPQESYETWFFKKVYEYRIENISGTFPTERLSIAEEAEFVTVNIPLSSISHYREVISVMKNILKPKLGSGIIFSEWKPL